MKKDMKPNRYRCLMTLSTAAFLFSGASSVCNAAEVLPTDSELPIEIELPVEIQNPIEVEIPIVDEMPIEVPIAEEGAAESTDFAEELFSMTEENPQVKLLRAGEFPDVISYADPYENVLNDEDAANDWKELFTRKYVDGLNSLALEIDISDLNIATSNSGAVFSLVRDILNRSPELFYARADMRIWYTSTKIVKIDQLYSDPYMKSDGSIDVARFARDKVRFTDRYNDAMSSINSNMTQVEKLLAIHDWIVRECDYDIVNFQQNTIPEVSYTARGVFLEGKAVCAGYAEAMAMCLNNAGIETVTVSSDAMNHAWNIVKLGNDYYHVDATWDDPAWTGYDQYRDQVNEGYTSHSYFIKSDREMLNECNHYGWNMEAAPKCNVSGSFANYPFRSYPTTNYTYSSGKWYYTVGDCIYRSDFSNMSSEWQKVTEAETGGAVTLLNAFTKDGALYYATTKNVFKLDSLPAGRFELKQAHSIYSVNQKHQGFQIREFALKQGNLHVNGDNNSGQYFDDLVGFNATILNGWVMIDGKMYWYEKGVLQGTIRDPQGVVGDGTIRGREIFDPVSNGWYWLDSKYNGAKAVDKEVWMPYIYQDEDSWDDNSIRNAANLSGNMAEQVYNSIKSKTGKWVRYDSEGKMYKGWYTVPVNSTTYPKQRGNTYYYDPMTGLMAKGWTFIDNIWCYFDEVTGVYDARAVLN